MTKEPTNYSASQKLIFDNIRRLYHQLSELEDPQRESLIKFVIEQCYLVVVTTTDNDSAYRIFSVMNDRGLDLSPTDILKANTIGKIDKPDQDYYGQKWENIEERIGRNSFRHLFAHIRMITVKSKLRRTLQADFQDNVLNDKDGIEFIDGILEPYADVYDVLLNATYESTKDAEAVNSRLRHLVRLDNFDWIPPAMAFFYQHCHDRESLIMFIRDLERLAYGLFVCRANVNVRIARYADVLNEIENNGDLFYTDSPLQLRVEEMSQIIDVLNGKIYLETPVVWRTLLVRLNNLLAEDDAEYEGSTITVEHVLPQHPKSDSEWISWFPDEVM